MRIAVPITAASMDEALRDIDKAVEVADIIELRLDFMSNPNLERLLRHSQTPKIVTNRTKLEGGRFEGSEEQRIAYLKEAISLGAAYVDIESDYFHPFEKGSTKLIVSHHNFERTPENLEEVYRKIAVQNPDIVKLAMCATSFVDVTRMLEIILGVEQESIGLSMDGKDNPKYVTKSDVYHFQKTFVDRIRLPHEFWYHLERWVGYGVTYSGFSRVISPLFGGHLTFASLNKEKASAPGQLSVAELRNAWQLLQVK